MKKRLLAAMLAMVLVISMVMTGCGLPEPTDPTTTTPQKPTATQTKPTVTDPKPTDPRPTEPTVPVTQPTEPTVPVTQPTEPTVPVTQPTEPTVPVTQPTEPTVPVTQPTEPQIPVLVNIWLITLPHKTTYLIGERLDTSGGVLCCEYSDGSVKDISLTPSMVSGFENATAPGVYSLTVTYTEDGIVAQTTFDINMQEAPRPAPVLVSISLVAMPKTEYMVGQWLDTSGGVIRCTYSDGSTMEIMLTNSMVSGFENATAPGVYTLTIRYTEDGVVAQTTYEITMVGEPDPGPVLVTSITVSGGKEVTVGNTLQLKAEVKPNNAADSSVTWSIISGNEFATISQNGLLTAVAPGTVTVQVAANDGSGVKATHKVDVKPILVSQITVSGASTVKVGKTIQLSAAIKPENAANKAVKWSISSGSSYASITQDGVLTGIAAGKVTVKVTAQDGSGISATFTVTVEEGALWDGSGTEKDPFLIRNLQDLMNLQKVTKKSGYYFKQVADIDCSSVGNWIVIGDLDNPFRHNYDGGGYTISNLCFDGEATGLFQVVENAHFKNMHIINAHSSDNHVTYPDNSAKYPGGGETGAIAGRATNCSFQNCTATVNFQSSNATTGGLVGFVVLEDKEYALMEDCHVSGTITGNECTGGLIGQIWHYMSNDEYMPSYTITVKNCSADVDIIIFTNSTETACVGGLIGKSFGVFVEQCHTTGTINVIDGDIGGLIGDAGNYTDVTRCYSTMDIYISSDDHYGGVSAGGLIGHIYSRSDVYDCYATGDITAPYVEWSPCQDSTNKNGGPWRRYYNPCGSLIGTLEVFKAYSEDQKINVYNCYATGKVDVPNICEDERVYCHGALIGLVLDRNTVLASNIKDTSKKDLTWDDFKDYYIGHFGNNYNLENLRTYYEPINEYSGSGVNGLRNPKYNTLPQHEYVEIITETQLLDESIFVGWDFENVWIMTEHGPQLR